MDSGTRRSDLSMIVILFLIASIGWLGCTTYPSSNAVQAGDTVAIPLASEFGEVSTDGNVDQIQELSHVAYGGVRFDDPQRGKLIINAVGLNEIDGIEKEFVTQYAIPVDADKRSAHGPRGLGSMVVLVVDIPSDTEPGRYRLDLYHEAPDTAVRTPVTPAYGARLTMLPSSLVFGCNGATCSSTGAPHTKSRMGTTWYDWRTGGWGQAPANLMESVGIPAPGFQVAPVVVDDPDDVLSTLPLSAYQFEVSYPADLVTISHVTPDRSGHDSAWFEDDQNGTITVHALSMTQGQGVGNVWINFDLVEDAPGPALVGDFVPSLLTATDPLGVELSTQNVSLDLEIAAGGIR